MHIIYVIIGGLGKIFAELIYKVENEIHLHPFYLGIACGLGMSLSIIPYIILKIKTKSSRKNQRTLSFAINNVNAINANARASFEIDEETKFKKKMIYQKYLLILLTGFLDFLQKILSNMFIEDIIYNFWIFDMIFLSLFSYIILKNKLYKHQFLSLGIMILLGVILNVLSLLDAKKHEHEGEEDHTEKGMNFRNILLIFSIEVIYSFSMVINKYLIDYRFSTPYEISCYAGCLNIFLNIILLGVFTNIEITNEKYQKVEYKDKFYLDNFYQYISKISLLEIIVFIVIMITRLLFNLFSNITVKYYTPSHIALILLIGEITFIFNHERDLFFYIKVVITLLITFFLLVFLEIIELNFCGLEKYTRKNIAERADKASGQSDDSNDVDGLEIHSNSSSDEENSKDNNAQSSKKLEPDKEFELGTAFPQ